MKIDLTDAQVSLIIDGLRALQENAAYENKCTSDSEIHDSNNQMADEVDDLCASILTVAKRLHRR